MDLLEAFPGYTFFKETSRLASEQNKASTAAHTSCEILFCTFFTNSILQNRVLVNLSYNFR